MPDGSDAAPGPADPMFGYLERFASVLVAAGILQVSPAAVSGAVRYLIQVGLVHKERVPGSRRDYYRMPDDVWNDMFKLRDQVMQRWAALVREGIELLGPDTPAGARLTGHATFFEFVSRELPEVLKRWDEYQATTAGPRPGAPAHPGG